MGIPLSHVFWPALGGTPGQAAHGPHVHDPHDYPGLRPLNTRLIPQLIQYTPIRSISYHTVCLRYPLT